MKKQEKIIFLGMLIILIGIVIKIISNLLTTIIVIIGAYFVIKGVINIDNLKKKKLKK
jgi:uncharacterized membrane protein HdeD (DUF308 family)